MVNLKHLYHLIALLTLSLNVHAKDFGVMGHTFPIIEPDLLETIQDKLQILQKNGMLLEHQKTIQQKTIAGIKKPRSVLGLIKTKQRRLFQYNPSIKVPYDLKDHQGRIFVKANTLVNPLDYFKLSQKLLFIDGEDEAQVQWALKQVAKMILVNGSPFKLSEQYQKRFYFDQGDLLTKKLGIQHVPAQVFQHNQVLNIEEVVLEETS